MTTVNEAIKINSEVEMISHSDYQTNKAVLDLVHKFVNNIIDNDNNDIEAEAELIQLLRKLTARELFKLRDAFSIIQSILPVSILNELSVNLIQADTLESIEER